VAVFSISAELAPGRRNAAGTWDYRLLRNGRWAIKFGPDYARRLKRKAPSRHDIWHLDEVVISIHGEKRYLWRAVDQDGYVLDEIVQIHRNTKAARRLLTRLLRKQKRPPKRIITDKLGSYAAARHLVMPNVEHCSHKGLNNRAENSHVPIRKRERVMQGFRSWPGLQRFVPIFSAVRNLFVPSCAQRSAFAVRLRWRNGNPSQLQRPEITNRGQVPALQC
jgi:putative transposase